ncbi:hypothetical protein GGH91_004804 [Coemansia sp. RSA 2671]|uniref:Uncharacterized protein n=2 Tax=Coemansia TaxID=4863 RepID=A0A9W8GQE6_9FUNG|nr:hypothetical protein LPJ60_004249 [Coemansia sp. RSA 2675]KAJ2018740.1 hypothetical protein IWW57_005192 [Coemansia sp. S610]KAJ2025892.1 hypothetical protein GGI06_000394 [Coemansia sp. S85]KAJ2338465.1 hypothetical protein GGH91_004804 [Coemansia sp. RSA 2671]KAJ2414173.1 hypothetical protein GGI10_002564 [Coemansia sp. RSA 2530]KAJ2689616.1 hypothetical protein IWW39_001322 [Coemansia spiralis]KAJ2693737.1 hypothetical protein H4218_005911 [Coemansia sp. IMI 209128]KAJ2791258.1 hypothe
MTIVIGANFGYCVLAAVGISVQCFLEGMAVTVARKKFNVPYPDNGGGRFADKLSEKDWVAFNNIKRVSDNYSESVGMVLSMLFCAGLFQPLLAASLGGSFIVGKIFYGMGYKAWGPKGRMLGAPVSALSFFALIAVAGYNAAITVFA